MREERFPEREFFSVTSWDGFFTAALQSAQEVGHESGAIGREYAEGVTGFISQSGAFQGDFEMAGVFV